MGNPHQGSTYTLPQGGIFEGGGDLSWPGFFSLRRVLLDPIKLWYLTAGVQLLRNKRGSNSPTGPRATRK